MKANSCLKQGILTNVRISVYFGAVERTADTSAKAYNKPFTRGSDFKLFRKRECS